MMRPRAFARRWLHAPLASMALGGCSYYAPIDQSHVASVKKGDSALVLARITCDIHRGDEVISDSLPYFAFGLGSFESMGEPVLVFPLAPSNQASREGWICLTLPPGTYYLAVSGPSSSRSVADLGTAPRWRLDVPEDCRALYAGTIACEGGSTNKGWFLATSEIAPRGPQRLALGDLDDASRIATSLLDGASAATCIPLRPWHAGEPIAIRTPRTSRRAS